MGFFKTMFTWWDGATLGTRLFSWRSGARVGADAAGNVYFRAKKGDRRWVIYNGPNDASRIPPEWYSWIHHQIDGVPDAALPPVRAFEKPATGNRTGTAAAYLPAGAMERGGRRQAASGDYQAWVPE